MSPFTFQRLYFCYDKKLNLSEQVAKATNRYKEKKGDEPTAIWFRPDEIPDKIIVAGLKVEVDKSMINSHFAIGVESGTP